MAEQRKAEEFFYTEDDSPNGVKQDAELHNAIINPVDYPIDEKIMAPIRAKHRAAYEKQRKAETRTKRWRRIRAKAERLLAAGRGNAVQLLRVKERADQRLANGQNDLYRGWNEGDHPRAPAGGTDGGQFVGDGGGKAPGGADPARGEAADQRVGGQSPTYAREGPSDAQRSRGVVGIWRSTPEAEAQIRAAGEAPQTFYEYGKQGAAGYRSAILRAKDSNKFGASVHAYEAADYENMRLFTSPDGLTGFALKGNDVVSLFKHSASKTKGVAAASLQLATEQGGQRLDAFDTVLPTTYSDAGFTTVARLKWNDTYQPEGWDKETFKEFNNGEPDVVFMVFDPAKAKLYVQGEGRYVPEYDDGNAAQAVELAKPRASSEPTMPGPHASDPTSASSLLKIEPAVTVESIVAKVPGSAAQIAEAEAKLKTGVPTDAPVEQGGHKLPNGQWTPERLALHRQIGDRIMTPEKIAAARPAPGEQPVLHILGGRGGSGKSWFTGKDGTFDASKTMYLNADDFKAALPEYQGWNAALLHEESNVIGNALELHAKDLGLNVTIDATLKSGATTAARIKAYREAGYRIEGHYMYASPANAAERALGRFVRGNAKNGKGRFVPPSYSLSSLTNEHSFDEGRKDMAYWEVYDNDSGGAPKLHSRSTG